MIPSERRTLLALHAASVFAFVGWAAWLYLVALAGAFGNVNPARTYGEAGAAAPVLVALLTLVCIVLSRRSAGRRARAWAIAPLALILASQAGLSLRKAHTSAGLDARDRSLEERVEELAAQAPRQFVYPVTERDLSWALESFLFLDEASGLYVRIDRQRRGLTVLCPARLREGVLEWEAEEDPGEIRAFYEAYVDAGGRSIFAGVEARPVASLDTSRCPTERFELR